MPVTLIEPSHRQQIVKMLTEPAIATIVVNSVFPFLAILAVAVRFYARRLKHLALRVDDYTIFAALVRVCSSRNLLFADISQVITVGGSMPYIYGMYRSQLRRL